MVSSLRGYTTIIYYYCDAKISRAWPTIFGSQAELVEGTG